MRYTVKDIQTGRVFFNTDNYKLAATVLFIKLDQGFGGKEGEYLHVVDNTTGRCVSVVL
jgi:hypothetical protein